jgi:hypothetical protein
MSDQPPSSNEDLQRQINELRERLDRALHQWPIPHLPAPYMPQAVPPFPRGCPVCGIGANGEVMGYVCPRMDCPTRITC